MPPLFPFTALVALAARRAPAADEVKVLPGWNLPLPSKMYSGYVNTSEMMGIPCQVHYWFIESEGDPQTDPTILWTNGGPGASSMFGITVELGPLLLNEYSLSTDEYFKTGVPTLYRNDFSWSKLGSILMFDWAPPVGFSYCNNDPTGDGFSCGKWDDERMAKLSYAALLGWYDLFPERRDNKLYLTGESYAGIYVPKLAQQILLHNDPKVRPQLAGFAVGDGCLGTESGVCGSGNGPWWDVLFLYGHHQISTELFDELVSECGMDYLKYAKPEVDQIKCREALKRIDYEKGGYFGYALYDDCIYQEGLRRRRRRLDASLGRSERRVERTERVAAVATTEAGGGVPVRGHGWGGALNDYVCGGGDAYLKWIASDAVRTAMHVPLNSYFYDSDGGGPYSGSEKNLMPFYHQVAATTDLKVLIYNGDADPSINSFEAANWTSHMGYIPTQTWRPWTLDNCLRMGGYVTRYQDHRFDFLTIRGSGHMVPQFKPEPALEFLRAWIKGEDYKHYNSSCTHPP